MSELAEQATDIKVAFSDALLIYACQRIRCCRDNAHSAMREVEILHDRLTAMLVADDSLLASEIAVLLPDMGPYAPLIEAVFGGAKASGAPNIPFNIADLTTQQECPAVDVLLLLLKLPESRCKADEVYGLLETPQVAARFGIQTSDLNTLRHWIAAAGIRWGLDAAHRGEFDLADMGAANTWQAGLDRLLLGVALPNALAGENIPLWGEGDGAIAPWDDLEGSQAGLLAKLMSLIAALKFWRTELACERSLPAWRDAALALLDAFILFDEQDEVELKLAEAIRTTLAALAGEAELAGFAGNTDLVPREVMVDWLQHRFENSSRGSGFMSRGVTFCTMVPMRGLPFRVIAVLGLNENEFPRNPPTAGFDLIAQNPLLGDRSRRLDDRYLFLDIILAAREKLYLSWVGRSLKDDAHFPPSVLVSDVLDCVAQGFLLEGDLDASLEVRREHLFKHLITEYPLQPFSLHGFESNTADHRLKSFNPLWRSAAQQIATRSVVQQIATRSATQKIAAQPLEQQLSEPLETQITAPQAYPEFIMPAEIRWNDLAQCLAKPVAYFLRHRAHLYLQEKDGSLLDDEAFDLKDFRDSRIRELGLKYGLAAHDLAFARGDTPLGTPGEMMVAEQLIAASALRDALPLYRSGEALEPQAVNIGLQSVQITGWLDDCYPTGRIVVRSQIFSREVFRVWVEHLVLCANPPPAMALITRCLSPERVFVFAPLEKQVAIAHLADVVALYGAAMSAPLPFFPHTALAWAKEDDIDLRWEKGLARWLPSFQADGEWLEVQNQLLWPEDPLEEGSAEREVFAAWAERIVLPILDSVIDHDLASDIAMLEGARDE